jgi:hypothetical protein
MQYRNSRKNILERQTLVAETRVKYTKLSYRKKESIEQEFNLFIRIVVFEQHFLYNFCLCNMKCLYISSFSIFTLVWDLELWSDHNEYGIMYISDIFQVSVDSQMVFHKFPVITMLYKPEHTTIHVPSGI